MNDHLFRQQRPNTTANRLRNHKPTVYIVLLVLAFCLGYYTASSPPSNPKPIQLETAPSITTVLATDDNCPPAATSSLSILDKNNDHNLFGSVCAKPIRPEEVRSTIINEVYNGTSPYEDFPPPHLAKLLHTKKVKGWGSYGAVFENLIKKTKPKVIIEVGTFLGASATHMAELTQKLGLETQILCLDDFRGWPGFRDRFDFIPMENADVLLLAQFMQNVVQSDMEESIIPLPFSTGSGLQRLCDWGVRGDLIEVDAGHDFHSAWSDINMAYKLLNPNGGVMFGHDYHSSADNKGVKRAVDLFAKVRGFKVTVDGQHWVLH